MLRDAGVLACATLLYALTGTPVATAHESHHHDTQEVLPIATPAEMIAVARRHQVEHRFDDALTILETALSLAPREDPGWLMAASIHLLRGAVDSAAEACRRLSNSPSLAIMTCHARVHTARGNPKKALRLLSAALQGSAAVGSEWLAWAYGAAGDAARSANNELAIDYYRRSLSEVDNEQVRAALVDVLLQEEMTAAADEVLDSEISSLALKVRRLIVDRRLDRLQYESVAELDRTFKRFAAAGDFTHAREMARFYLDVLPDLQLAREFAERNIAIQREPEDVLLVARTQASRPSS